MPWFVRSSEISLTPDIAYARSGPTRSSQRMVQRPNLSISHREQISPLCPAYFPVNDSARNQRKSLLLDILQDIREAALANDL